MDTKQLTGQGVAEAGMQVHQGAQHSGVGGINMLKKKRTGTTPNTRIPEPGRLPLRTSFTSEALSVRPSCYCSQVTRAASLRPAAPSSKGEEEVCVTHLTPQLTCLHGFSHAMPVRLQSSREISSNNKYVFKASFSHASFTRPDKQTTYTSLLLSVSSHKQMSWKSGPETVRRAKIHPRAIRCLGIFPTFFIQTY